MSLLGKSEKTTLPARMPEVIEHDLRETVRNLRPKSQSGIGNSTDMNRVQELVKNAITAAHEDTGKALDKMRDDARELLNRLETEVDQHKEMLQAEGQRIAYSLQAAVQELTRTVKWVEDQSPRLREPRLEPAAKNKDEDESSSRVDRKD